MKRLTKQIGKKALSFVCAAAITVTLIPHISAAAAVTAQTTDYLNLRAGAGTNQKIVLTLSKGITVTIIDNSNATWAKVQTSGGTQGYCSKEFLNISGASSTTPLSSASGTLTALTTSSLNMRSGAGTNNKIVATLPNGTKITVIDNSNTAWAKVQTSNGLQGYCSKEFLKMSSAAAATPATSTPTSTSSYTAVTTDYLNMREGAGTNYKTIVTISKGITLKVLDNSNGQWAKVQTSNGKVGYCSKQYLKITSTGTTTSPTTPTTPTTTIPSNTATATGTTTSSLNVRSGAGTNFSIVVTLANGTSVTVLENSDTVWAKIKTADGKVGYCSKQYLKIAASTGTTTPTTPDTSTLPATTQSGTTTSSLNVRSGAGTNFGVIVTLTKGATVTVVDSSNATWAKVKTADGKEGYCSKEFLTIIAAQNPGTGTVPNTGTDTGTETDPIPDPDTNSHTITGASVTADILRLRATASASGTVLANLPKGTSLKVLDTTDPAWTKVQTSGGQSGYVSTEFIQLHYSDDTSNADSLSLSTASQSIPAGKTLYIKASISPSDTYINWTSSNTAVATVSNGYVYAVSNGTAVITASAGSYKATCNVTVIDSEPVKTTYASPNIVSTGATVTLNAVTDTTRDGVQFSIYMPDGSIRTLTADTCTTETMLNTSTKKWTATTTFDTAGTYSYTAYSSLNGIMSTTGCSTSAYVSTQQDFSITTNEARRISDQMIALIAKWEGYRSTVYADMLTANQVPTIGYGCTFGANAIFYNDMTETEAWSMLVNKINNSSYTSELNKMIQNNKFLMNQNQADCLISFAYNVGAGYFNSSSEMDFRRIMKNAVIPPIISGGESLAATVTKDTVVRGDSNVNASQVCSASSGTVIAVTDSNFTNPKDGWYKVQLSDGSTGWINSGYVNLSNSGSLTHDLNYTNAYAIGTDLLRWSTASSKFYTGLFYRRMGEVNAYNYGDYNAVRYNQYNYTYPSGAAGLN